MTRHDRRAKLTFCRLEDRNAASDTLHALLGGLGIASIFDTSSFDSATTPKTSLSAVDPSYLAGTSNSDANSVIALNSLRDPVPPSAPAAAGDSSADRSLNDLPPIPSAFGPPSWLAGAFSFDPLAADGGAGRSSMGETPVPQLVDATPAPSHGPLTVPADAGSIAPSTQHNDGGLPPLAGEPAGDADGVSASVEAQAPNHGDGNRDGVLDANQNNVTSLRASAGGSFVTVDGGGHTLTNVRAMAAPAENPGNVSLPMGMFGFEVRGVARGGAAEVKMFLPEGSTTNHYFKQDSAGALQRFDFDGTTGAEFHGNVVTLHFIDGGRGDADGVANGVIRDPGGPGDPVDIVTAAKVREVTFSGASLIRIVADPGTPAYPTGAQWLDNNVDGVIDAAVGDRALPVGYPRNTDSIVSAHFNATIESWPCLPNYYDLKVRGFNILSANQPYSYIVPPTAVQLSGNDLYLPPTAVTYPFQGTVNYGSLTINWEFSNNNGTTWNAAGQTSNELYVTLAAPSTSPVYHTLLYTSVPSAASIGAATEAAVVGATWSEFSYSTTLLKTKHVDPAFSGKPLTYYKQWNNETVNTVADLLNATTNPKHDGKCYAFVELFTNSLKAAGVTDTTLLKVRVWSDKDGMLIKDWDFVGNGTANVTINNVLYPYQNTLADPTLNPNSVVGGVGSFTRKNTVEYLDGPWEYYWGTTAEVTDDLTGVPGQGTPNPKSHFTDHWIVKIYGQYYDPSYGKRFDSLQAWEDGSVKGFYTINEQGANTNFRLVFRKNPPGPDISSSEV